MNRNLATPSTARPRIPEARAERSGHAPRREVRRRRRRATATRSVAVWVLATTAAVTAAMLPGPQGTEIALLDPIVRALLVLGVAWTAARARPGAWIAAAAITTVGTTVGRGAVDTVGLAVAVAVAVAGLGAMVADRLRTRGGPRPAPTIVGAGAGAGLTLVVLHLPAGGPYGGSALVAAAVVTVLVGSGVRHCPPRLRRRIQIGIAASVVALGCLVGAFAISAVVARPHADAGAEAARSGIDAARAGKARRAIAHFDESRRRLAQARRVLDQPWARAAAVVPGLAHQERALRRMLGDAVDLATVGARTVRDADVSRIRPVDGRIDPASLAGLEAPLLEIRETLRTTGRSLDRLDATWLVPPLRNARSELRVGLDDAIDDADGALLATRAAYTLLGGAGTRRYFVMFTTPTETRGTSGFLGNYGILTADDGRLDLTAFGRNLELTDGGDPASRTLTGLDEYLTRYRAARPAREWRDINFTPDFPTVAEVVRQLYPQSGGTPIDGVLAVDPRALSALLTLTGPVLVTGLDEPLNAENASRILLRDQYTDFPAIDARTDFLSDVARTVTDRLTGATLPGPRDLGALLGPEVARKHLLFTTFDESGNALLDRLGTRGRFGPFPGDALALVTQNLGGNKIDQFLHRSIDVRTTIDPATGTQRSSVTVRLRNDAPASGLPAYVIGNRWRRPSGTNMAVVSLYSRSTLESATIDGEPVALTTGREVFGVFDNVIAPNAIGRGPVTFSADQELGLEVFTGDLEIAPGTTRELRFELVGPARLLTGQTPPRYRLDLWQQPVVNADRITVTVETSAPWALTDPAGGFTVRDGRASFESTVRRDRTLTVALDGPPTPAS